MVSFIMPTQIAKCYILTIVRIGLIGKIDNKRPDIVMRRISICILERRLAIGG